MTSDGAHHQTEQQLEATASLTSALVEANDQLLALYGLTEVNIDSLDGQTSVREILDRATTLLSADALILHPSVGEPVSSTEGRMTSSERTPSHVHSLAPTTASITVTNASDWEATLIARRSGRPFGTADHKLLTAVANMALGALHTSHLHREAIEQAVVARDHDTASELAIRALPRWTPTIAGAELFARSDPARAAGGDLFTYAEIGDILHFVVGDVSGKGLPAAMMMTNVISASHAAFQEAGRTGPAAVLARIDAWMYEFLSDAGLFVTMIAGAFDQQTGELRLANAGHSPVMWCSRGQVKVLEADIPPIGVLPFELTPPFDETVKRTEPGDRLIVASDGLTEQRNPSGEMFGEDRLATALTFATHSTKGQAERLFDQVESFAAGTAQEDDRTLLVLSITGTRQDQA